MQRNFCGLGSSLPLDDDLHDGGRLVSPTRAPTTPVHLLLVDGNECGIQAVDELLDGHAAGKVTDPAAIPSLDALQLAVENGQGGGHRPPGGGAEEPKQVDGAPFAAGVRMPGTDSVLLGPDGAILVGEQSLPGGAADHHQNGQVAGQGLVARRQIQLLGSQFPGTQLDVRLAPVKHRQAIVPVEDQLAVGQHQHRFLANGHFAEAQLEGQGACPGVQMVADHVPQQVGVGHYCPAIADRADSRLAIRPAVSYPLPGHAAELHFSVRVLC